MDARNAVEWHTQIAKEFNSKYIKKNNFKERYKVWTNYIDEYSNINYHVLDLGCGSGIFTFYAAFKNKSITGIDASDEMLHICNEKTKEYGNINVNFLKMNIEDLTQYNNPKSDLVICSSVLEYIEDLDQAIEIIKQKMNTNGILLLSLPNKDSVYRSIEALSFKFFGIPKYYKYVKNVNKLIEIEKKLQKNGFKILDTTYYGETPILSWIFRKLNISKYSDNLFIIISQL